MVSRLEFTGTGGELLGKVIVGALLTMVTFGIYGPWFFVALQKYFYEHTRLKTPSGDLRFEYTGTGGGLFGALLVGYLLTLVTFGLYMPWFMCNLTRYSYDHSVARAADGTVYRGRFNGTGGDLFVTFLVGAILCGITLYIYTPWFICKLNKFFLSRTDILRGDAKVGGFDFAGEGGALLGTFLLGMILTMFTFGIYGAWFQVKMFQFLESNTRVTVDGVTYAGEFTGTGVDNLVMLLVGNLLTMVTFGIYGAWFACNQRRFRYNNTGFRPLASQGVMGGGAMIASRG